MLSVVVVLVCLAVAGVQGQNWGARPQTGMPNEGRCSYTFTVDASQMQDSCRTDELEQIIQNIQLEYTKVKEDNDALREELDTLRSDYESMVEAVKTLETDTASWREIIEWPSIEMPFEPNNASLIIMDEPKFSDCWEAHQAGHTKQGIYTFEPEEALAPFFGYCDDEGWNVIQRRFDGSVDFHRSWDEYSKGFGLLSGEFWLGLENMHLLTSQKEYEFRIEFMGWNGKLYHSNYDDFAVKGELDEYALQVGNMSSGNYLDVMSDLDGVGFTTKGRDNDEWYTANCAEYYRGGFWLRNCGFDPSREWCSGTGCMQWGKKLIKKSVMKVRPMEAKGEETNTGKKESKKQPRKGKTRSGKKNKKRDRETKPDRETEPPTTAPSETTTFDYWGGRK